MVTTNTERVRAGLEQTIVSGALAPGSTLDEAELSQTYDVSRTPVREALLQLAAEGYVRIVPRAGIYVVQLSASELSDMCEFLAYAEGLCAKLACQRINAGQLKKLGQLQEAGRRALDAQDADAYAHYSMAFHECLYAASGNRYLRERILYIRKRTNPYRQLDQTSPVEWSRLTWEHRAKLLAVLQAHDAEGAMRVASDFVKLRAASLFELAESSPEHLFFEHGMSTSGQQGRGDMSQLFRPLWATPPLS